MDAPEWIVKELDHEKNCKERIGREIEQRGEGNLGKTGRSARRRHEKKEKYLEELEREVGEDKELRTMRTLENIIRSLEDCAMHDLV